MRRTDPCPAAPLTPSGLLLEAAASVRPQLVRAVLAGLVWQGLAVLVPLLVGRALDEGVAGGDGGRLAWWAGALCAVGLAEAWASRVRHQHASASFALSAAHLRQRLLTRAQQLDAAFHERLPPGAFVARATSDVEHIARMLDCVAHTVAFAVTLVAVSVLLFVVDPWLGLLVVVGLSPVTLLVWRTAPRQRSRAQRLQEAIERAVVDTSDTVAAFEVVRGLGADEGRRAVLRRDAETVRERGLGVHRLNAAVEPFLGLVPALTLAATLSLGGHLVLSGRTSVGELVAVLGYVALVVTPTRVLGERVLTVQRALASAERLVEILASRPVVREAVRAQPVPPGWPPPVDLHGVVFSRPQGDVLDDVSLRVGAGERVAVVGPPGSGKSTLLRLVARQYDADQGEVRLGGVDVRHLRLRELRRSVALVDDSMLFDDSVAGNIAFGTPGASEDAVEGAARAAGAHRFVARLDRTYATRVGPGGSHLSGGQRQRLALARALLPPSPVLLLDDVTSALDPATEAEVVTALDVATRGRTVLAVTSRPAVLSLAERVVLLDSGRVVADGTHEELLRTSDVYARLLAEATIGGERA